jgi:hypothetical protein
MHLAGSETVIVAASLRTPFGIAVFHPDGTVAMDIQPTSLLLGNALGVRSTDLEAWVALPALPLDKGLIQTLSDLRSDLRLLVVYDTDGSVLRHRQIDVPLGLVASAPARQELLAVRRVNEVEAVLYRWCWSAASCARERD